MTAIFDWRELENSLMKLVKRKKEKKCDTNIYVHHYRCNTIKYTYIHRFSVYNFYYDDDEEMYTFNRTNNLTIIIDW